MTENDRSSGFAGRSFLFLLGSGREGGNTEALARHAAAQLPQDVPQRWLRLSEHPLPPFEDPRHTEAGVPAELSASERLLLDATLDATDLVIASPLYWYSVSASTKLYFDHWVNWLVLPGADFKQRMAGRTLWGITAANGAAKPGITDSFTGMLSASAEYMGMQWGGTLLGQGNAPGDVEADNDALLAAKSFFS
ncbi:MULTISPECIES: NAD(P)H-dependent oxidoreductase [Streptomyces]|uniref:NAD(P)H-dependent oxidoreductase n=1 Tax=Streptomyces luteosporeus TaxID=173856 RepID=A0ABN3U7Z2_9ACTN